jgi:hypothetical protein
MLHVCGITTIIHSRVMDKSGKWGETRNSCLLSVYRGNESRHLIFWSLETLTGVLYNHTNTGLSRGS